MTESEDRAGERDLLVTRDGGILRITLNRPDRRNALTAAMVDTVAETLEAADLDDATRVVLLRGAGADFCSGFDIGGPGGPGGGGGRSKPRAGHMQRGLHANAHRLVRTLSEVQLPIVAAVRGWAAGFGNALALSADVVVATPDAQFWVPFVPRGFTPDSATTYLLPRLVGLPRAKEMVLRGKPIDGTTAAAWGLISECVADDELDAAAEAVVAEFAAAATVSVGLAKRLLHQNLGVDIGAALHNEAMAEELALRSDDFKEGMRAFAERRPPDYTGR
jgi:2-(1,2-epoxy-1,2-dihydrophenyl)acetyl-CoA isomerase